MRRFFSVVCASAALQFAPGLALANTEAVVAYNGRSSGMGFTGVAYTDTAAAILHNPANLTDVKHLSIDVSFNPDFVKLSAPVFMGAKPPVTMGTQTGFSPLGFVGVAYRGHPRVTLGVAGLIMDAGGVKYANAPQTIFATLSTAQGTAVGALLSYELRIPIAIKITDWLSVAAGYRMTFANQITSFDVGGVKALDRSFSGSNYASAQAGITVKPISSLNIGLAYRSRTKVALTGRDNTSVTGQGAYTYVAPHQFTAGVAWKSPDRKLLLAGDFKYWMYADAYAGQNNHRDAFSGHLGGEYHINKRVPVRAGYFAGRSTIREQAASAFTTSPKIQMGGTVGSGYHFDLVDLDAAVVYGEAGGTVKDNPLPGKYHLRLVGFGVSASFHL